MVTKEIVLEKLKTVIDPELNVNIVELGLIYDVQIKPEKEILRSAQDDKKKKRRGFDVTIRMTLTTPGCPLSYVFENWIPEAVKKIKRVKNVYINLVWEPLWDPDKMSDEAKEKIGIFS